MGVDELQGVVGGGAAQVDHEGSPLVHRSGPVVGVAGGEIDLNTGASEDIPRKAICFIFINVLIDDSPASATNSVLGSPSLCLRLGLAVVDNYCSQSRLFLGLLTSLNNLVAFIIAKADDL